MNDFAGFKPPLGPLALDARDPLTRGLRRVWLLNEWGGRTAREHFTRQPANVVPQGAVNPRWATTTGGVGVLLDGNGTTTSSYLDLGPQVMGSRFTVELSFYLSNIFFDSYLVSNYDPNQGSGGAGFRLTNDSGNGRLGLTFVSTTGVEQSANAPLGSIYAGLHHVTIVRGDNALMYLNGRLAATGTAVGTSVFQESTAPLVLGHHAANLTNHGFAAPGSVFHHARCWNRALTGDEVRSLHRAPYRMFKLPIHSREQFVTTPPVPASAGYLTPFPFVLGLMDLPPAINLVVELRGR